MQERLKKEPEHLYNINAGTQGLFYPYPYKTPFKQQLLFEKKAVDLKTLFV